MAGRTFYKAADGSMTPAGKARAYNAELRRKARAGGLYTGESNFGTAGKDTGEIAYGDADAEVQNGDIIAVKNEDGSVTRTKVTAENRDELLNTRKGTMRPSVQDFSPMGPYQEGQTLKGGTTRRYDNDKKTSGGGRSGGRGIKIPASFNTPSTGGAKGARVANRNMQKVLQGKPLVSKKQKANAKRRADSKVKTAATRKKLKISRDKARVKTRATNARLRKKKADGVKKRREKRETKKFNKQQRKEAKRAKRDAAKPRRSTTDATATRVKKKVEKKAPKVSKRESAAAERQLEAGREKLRQQGERIDREIAAEKKKKQEKDAANLAAIRAIRDKRKKNNG